MPVIRIRERADTADGFAATVSVDDQGEYPITVTDPFGAEQEALLEWYFEEHLRFPFMRQVEAQAAAASPTAYGEALFQQVFGANAQLYARYLAGVQAGVANLRFAIAQSVSRRFTGVFGFDEELAANAALKVIKRVASAVQPVRRKAARKTTRSETLRLVGKTRKTKTTRTTLRKAAQKKAATRGRKTGAVRAKSHKTAGKATARPVKRTTRKATTGRKRGR